MIMYLIVSTIFRGPPIVMAIHPHCKPSTDALRTSVHFKIASEDIYIIILKHETHQENESESIQTDDAKFFLSKLMSIGDRLSGHTSSVQVFLPDVS